MQNLILLTICVININPPFWLNLLFFFFFSKEAKRMLAADDWTLRAGTHLVPKSPHSLENTNVGPLKCNAVSRSVLHSHVSSNRFTLILIYEAVSTSSVQACVSQQWIWPKVFPYTSTLFFNVCVNSRLKTNKKAQNMLRPSVCNPTLPFHFWPAAGNLLVKSAAVFIQGQLNCWPLICLAWAHLPTLFLDRRLAMSHANLVTKSHAWVLMEKSIRNTHPSKENCPPDRKSSCPCAADTSVLHEHRHHASQEDIYTDLLPFFNPFTFH